MYALKPDGTLRWTFGTGGPIQGAPAICSDGNIIFTSQDGGLYDAYNDGTFYWAMALNGSNPAIGSDGTIYIGGCAIGTQVDTVPVVSLAVAPTTIAGGNTAVGTVHLSLKAPVGGAEVHLQSSDPSVVVPAYVMVGGNATSEIFPVKTSAVSVSKTIVITGTSGGQTITATLTVVPSQVESLSFVPINVSGGLSSVGTITLNGAAPGGGANIILSSNNGAVKAPSSVVVPAGNTSVNFTATTTAVPVSITALVSASFGGGSAQSSLIVTPAPTLTRLTIQPQAVLGGNAATGSVTLDGPAPSGGLTMRISTTSLNVNVPATVVIPAAATSATFILKTTLVSLEDNAIISATDGTTSLTASLKVYPDPVLKSLILSPSSVVGGTTSQGTVNLTEPASTGGFTATLLSTNSTVQVPQVITVPTGSTSVSFTLYTHPVASTTNSIISASQGGTSVTATLISTVSSAYSPWPMSHANAQGNAIGVGSGANGIIRWTASVPGGGYGGVGSPVIGPDGTIYYTAWDGLAAVSPSGTVKWNFQTLGQVKANAVVAPDGTIYISSFDGFLYAVNPDGTQKWMNFIRNSNALTGNVNASSPMIGVDGTIYVGSQDGALYAIHPDGTLYWRDQSRGSITKACAIGLDGTIYFGSDDQNFYAVNPDGTEKWAFALGGNLQSDPMVGPDGTICFNAAFSLFALNPDGSQRWKSGWGGNNGTPAIGTDGTIYLSDANRAIAALNADGTPKWHIPDVDARDSSYSIASDGTIYAFCSTNLYAVSPKGVILWQITRNDLFSSTPAIGADGTVYFTDGGLNAVGTGVTSINPTSLTVSPSSVNGGSTATGTVTISQPAPLAGANVWLSSDNPVASIQSFVTVPGGATSTIFSIKTSGVGLTTSATITAMAGGVSVSASLDITPAGLAGLSVNPATVMGGNTTTGTVTLQGVAPVGGISIAITSNSPNVTVPSTVLVPAGASSANFTLTTTSVSNITSGKVTATYGVTSVTAAITVTPSAALAGFTLSPVSVLGGANSTGTVSLDAPAPSSGTSINLTSSIGSATVPAVITVPSGANTASFTINTMSVATTTSAIIQAQLGAITKTAALTIRQPASLTSVTILPSTLVGGLPTIGTLTLDNPAPQGGLVVNLSASTSFASMAQAVTVPQGCMTASFAITTYPVTTKSTLTVTGTEGSVSASAQITLTPGAFAPWPMPRNQASNSAYSIAGGSNGALKWSVQLAGSVMNFFPVVAADGTIYVGALAAIKADGSLLWQSSSTVQYPSIGLDGNLAGQTWYGFSKAMPDGTLIWTSYPGDSLTGSTTIGADGTYYFTAKTGGLYAVAPDGLIQWTAFVTNNAFVGTPALAPDGTVYVGDNRGYLNAVSSSGSVLWSYGLGSNVGTNPAVGPDNTIYIGSFDTHLYAVNPDGTGKWAFTLDSKFSTAPAIGPDGAIYVGTYNNSLFAINPDGSKRWVFTAPNIIESAPVIGIDGTIYFGCDDHNLYALNPDGTVQWTFATGNAIQTMPSIGGDGNLYVLSNDGYIYALGTQTSAVPVSNFTISPTSVASGASVTGTLTLAQPAPVGGNVVSFSSNSPGANPPRIISIPAGSTTASFIIATRSVPTSTTATVTASSGGQQRSASFTVTPPLPTGLALAPSTLAGGNISTGTVTLTNPAPSTGMIVNLTSNSANATVPASFRVPGNALSGTFSVMTSAVTTNTSATITATIGATSKTATLTIVPATLSSVSLSPSVLVGGAPSTGTVALTGAAPAGGTTIGLSSSQASASLPASVLIPAGASSVTFPITTTYVPSTTSDAITASVSSKQVTATLTLNSVEVQSYGITPTTVTGGATVSATVSLDGAAPTGGLVISLSSSDPSATVPSSITVLASQTSASFSITTGAVIAMSTVTLQAKLGNSSQVATLVVQPPVLSSFSMAPSTIIGGSSSTGTVSLTGPAPAGGISVILNSYDGSVTVPASVTIPAGSSSATFTATTIGVASDETVQIKANLGSNYLFTNLTVLGSTLSSVVLTPNSVQGGQTSTGTVTLTGPAGLNGAIVTLSVSNGYASAPQSVTIAAGATSSSFKVTTVSVSADTSSVVTSSLSNVSQTATLQVHAAVISSLTVSPRTVQGGSPSTGRVTLAGAAGPSGNNIVLYSNVGSVTVPTSVLVPAGSTGANFSITTGAVGVVTTATITGQTGQSSATAQLIVNPPAPMSLSLSPSTVQGGTSVTGTLTLTANAPNGGVVINLGSSSSAAVSPATVTVPAGANSVNFTINTLAVSSFTSVSINATGSSVTKSATLTITPANLTGFSIAPASVIGGLTATGKITLSGLAPAGGFTVTVTSSSSSVMFPATVTIAAGASTASFSILTSVVTSQTSATLTSSLNGTNISANIVILPLKLVSINMNPNPVTGGNLVQGTVTLNGPAPAGGTTVSLTSNSANAMVPSAVTIPAGLTSQTFVVTTKPVSVNAAATISAAFGGSTVQARLTILPSTLQSVSITPVEFVGGSATTVTCTVTLTGATTSAGANVLIVSSNPKVLVIPATVKIPAGASSASFVVNHKPVASTTQVSIRGTYGGQSQSSSATVDAFQMQSLSIVPASVIGGTASAATVNLNAAPGAGSGPLTLKLSSSSKALSIPASLVVAVGHTSSTAKITTYAVKSETVASVVATYQSQSVQAILKVEPPTVLSISVSPTTVKGSASTSVIGKVTLSGPAPTGGVAISLASSNSVAIVPTTVKIPAGATVATFTVKHSKVTSQLNVNISETLDGLTNSTTLTITP